MIGFALSSPPGKPTVAFYNEVPPGKGKITIGNQQLDVAGYAHELLQSINPIKVHSARRGDRGRARRAEALAAVIIPADAAAADRGLVTQGVGNPTVQVYPQHAEPDRPAVRRSGDPIAPQQGRTGGVQAVLQVAVNDLREVLNGGTVTILGQTVPLLGLRNARTIVAATIAALPPSSPLRVALRQVAGFADLAIEGLGFASPVLGLDRNARSPSSRRSWPARRRPPTHTRRRSRSSSRSCS